MKKKSAARETNPDVLRQAMIRRLPRRTATTGQIKWPAVPALLEHYIQMLRTVFTAVGRPFSTAEVEAMRGIMRKHLDRGFSASPHSKVVVDYYTKPPPDTALHYTISSETITIADEYAEWVKSRKPPLFGEHPDSKVLHLAASLGAPSEVTVLDVGAGTGRNTLPLARAGYATDAVELAPALAEVLRAEIAKEGLAVRVFEGNALDPMLELPRAHYRLVVLAEVVASHFRKPAEIRNLFERAAEWLAPGGVLLFSAFLSTGGYKPEPLSRQLSEIMWCCLFTRRELEEAVSGLPFALSSDESTHEFEHEHLDAAAWPPTGWFAEWALGQDLFDLPPEKPPMELRWLAYRKDAPEGA